MKPLKFLPKVFPKETEDKESEVKLRVSLNSLQALA